MFYGTSTWLAHTGRVPPDSQPPRPFSNDPDAFPEQTKEECVAQLPRHTPGVKTTNIIICGEPGIAAGRVISLIIGHTTIKPLTDYEHEAMVVTPIDVAHHAPNPGMSIYSTSSDPEILISTSTSTTLPSETYTSSFNKPKSLEVSISCWCAWSGAMS